MQGRGVIATRTSIHRHNTCPTLVGVGTLASASARSHYLMCFPDECEKTPNAKYPALFKRGFLKPRAVSIDFSKSFLRDQAGQFAFLIAAILFRHFPV